jgi:FtsZ-interacting cell division protein YlmF
MKKQQQQQKRKRKERRKKPLVEMHRNQIFESSSVVTVNAKKYREAMYDQLRELLFLKQAKQSDPNRT